MKPRVNIKIILLFISIGFGYAYSQDTTETAPPVKDTTIKPSRFILSDYSYSYINRTDPDTVTRNRFLWYPLKTAEDVFNYLPGFYLRFMDVGQVNQLNFNQMDNNYIAVLRHGRPVNDLIDGSADFNLFSRNEIDEIELTGGFWNTNWPYNTAVNVIQRQLFPNTPYTEISYFQDRYENLYFDGNFHQNILRTLNFNFGITKHSYDGHYINSDFDKWLGRFNLNFAPTGKLNFFTYLNYSSIKKGLNEGIKPDTVNIADKETMFNRTQALVWNPDAYEIKERFDIDAGAVIQGGKISYTKLQFYVSNSFRKYRDEENRPTPNGIFLKNNYHWINYGAKLLQDIDFTLFRKINLSSVSEVYYEYSIRNMNSNDTNFISSHYSNKLLRFIQSGVLKYGNLTLSGYLKGNALNDFNVYNFHSGIKAKYLVKLPGNKKIELFSGFNSYFNYLTAGVSLSLKDLFLSAEYYYYNNLDYYAKKPGGVNTGLKLKVHKINLDAVYSFNILPEYEILPDLHNKQKQPAHYGSVMLYWGDIAFRNRLEYRIGFNSRFWSDYYSSYYSGVKNQFEFPFYSISKNYGLKIPADVTLDFFVYGRIGNAVFGLTLENILNRLAYNSGVYPLMDRGGLLNVISRFNITWNFFN